MFDDQTSSNIVCWMIKHFTVWPTYLTMFDGVLRYLIVFELHQTFDQTTSNISFVLMFLWWCLVRLARCMKHVWLAHKRDALSHSLVSTDTAFCLHVSFSWIEIFSKDDRDSNENVVSKSNFSFLYLFLDYCNLLNQEP